MPALLPVWSALVAIAAATAAFGLLLSPREEPLFFLAFFFLSLFTLGWTTYRYRAALSMQAGPRLFALILGGALLLRLGALMAPVSLSDDIWRYLWDGQLLLDGASPYDYRPLEYPLQEEPRGTWLKEMNSPDRFTVYPPLSLLSFSGALLLEELFGGQAERWLRGIFVLFDLLGLALVLFALRYLKKPLIWATLYGWHPLVYWEVAGGGHTEALGIPFLIALLLFAMKGRSLAAGITIGLVGLAKWTFLAVSPVVAFYLWRRFGFLAAVKATCSALLVFLGAYLPFLSGEFWGNHRESIGLYSEWFSFNAPVYYSFRWILGYREGITEPVTHITGPTLTLLTLAAIATLSLWQNGEKSRLVAGACLALGAYLLFSAVFHPWYALGFLALGALLGWKIPAIVGALVVVSYVFYAPWSTRELEVALMAMQSLVLVGVMLMKTPKIIEGLLRHRGRQKAVHILEELGESRGLRILDLGGAEGFVAQALEEGGHQVEIIDIADRNRTDLPAKIYNGRDLPYEDRSFDLVVVSYVLHHSRDPDRLLEEALRVAPRVIALETVYEKEWDRKVTTFLDHSVNRLRGMKKEPLFFDRPQGWTARIEALGAEVQTCRWLGRGVHRHVLLNFFRKTD